MKASVEEQHLVAQELDATTGGTAEEDRSQLWEPKARIFGGFACRLSSDRPGMVKGRGFIIRCGEV